MDDPYQTVPAAGCPPPLVDRATAPLPERIGRYRIVKRLGKGGSGVVYLAHDEDLERPVAIKVPRRSLIARPQDAQTYVAEARIVAGLDHPHIVPVYDVGSNVEFPCFIVSKYIEGTTLAERIAAGRTPAPQAAELVVMVAETLHYAHRHGLVHRDIKPGNILLDKSGTPYVADFGLALREQDVGKGTGFLGTVPYMSPEQARGEGHRVDGRSDIFSLSVVFYELLTGRRPFQGDSLDEILQQVTSRDPRPPRQIDDTIPRELERICLRSLAKRAADRYLTARDMADDLRHFLKSSGSEQSPHDGAVDLSRLSTARTRQGKRRNDQRAAIVLGTFLFADFKGFTERVRILEETAGHQAAAEIKRTIEKYVEEVCRQLDTESNIGDYELIGTAGDGFFFFFQRAMDAFLFAELLARITAAHNDGLTRPADGNPHSDIAEHWFRTGATTGKVAWDDGEPVGNVVNVASRLHAASMGGDLVIDQATLDGLSPETQRQFGPKQIIQDKHGKTYEVYRSTFGRALEPLPAVNLDKPKGTPSSASQPVRIVPKGLRSFDAHDADFFLELLPGPRDRDGLPESIRFWKTRIEETDADNTFAVGLLYGPSGCGKSSLVKAGLLPRLAGHVTHVYVEATADETETRLLQGLRKRCPALPATLGLHEALAALRRGHGVPAGAKVLIVLDQFEQYLHARTAERQTALVHALRQCDGSRLQCVVMIRDDFWMAATRFMHDLEIWILEGRNSAAVDLIPTRHAEQVLAAFGRALGALPENDPLSESQHAFLNQAVGGLGPDGKVICVRLALFAEAMKSTSWIPATLRERSGADGVVATFLEETFTAAAAPPEHHYHKKAAPAVLKALLPEMGSDLKGHTRSVAELLKESGYTNRPRDFDELLRILDGKLHLITPTDPQDGEDRRSYQLTHDYLVPSLRDWLTREDRKTRHGRARLLLKDRAAVWNARPENSQLPSLWQWVNIRLCTRKQDWNASQRQMMRHAGPYHALRLLALVLILLVIGWIGYVLEARSLVTAVVTAETSDVLPRIGELRYYRPWANHLLRAELAAHPRKSKEYLNASLGLLPDPNQVDYLYERLLDAEPKNLPVLRAALAPHSDALKEKLWAAAKRPARGPAWESKRLRAASALAQFDAGDSDWETVADAVAGDLVAVQAVDLAAWTKVLEPIRHTLLKPLTGIFCSSTSRDARWIAAEILADYAADDPDLLTKLLMDADAKQFVVLFPRLQRHEQRARTLMDRELDKPLEPEKDENAREQLAQRQANAAVALLRLGDAEKLLPLLKHDTEPDLKHGRDPRRRSYIIHRIGPMGASAATIVEQVLREPEHVSIKRALILSMGEFDKSAIAAADRKNLTATLLETFRDDPDPGLHAAAEWLLRQWGHGDELAPLVQKAANVPIAALERIAEGKSAWYVNGEGQTMVAIPRPGKFKMGTPPSEAERAIGKPDIELLHIQQIDRTFAIAAKEVTVAEFLKCEQFNKHPYDDRFAKSDCPVNNVKWYEAAAYCNWLSVQEHLPKCYEETAEGMMRARPDYLHLTGYRLPTEAEWEYACRAGAATSRFYGESDTLLEKYAWYVKNSPDRRLQAGGRLKPNDLGLFDMLGNALEWCHDAAGQYKDGNDTENVDDTIAIRPDVPRIQRGGSFAAVGVHARCGDRSMQTPEGLGYHIGFRVARTLPSTPAK